jgi:SacI restriction endonuclease
MPDPNDILNAAFQRANVALEQPLIADPQIQESASYIARNLKNRAAARLLMACLLAKLHRPEVDIRKPYTEIGDSDVFSGRTYDERYLTMFINKYDLPCNSTTAFLTPALRNRNTTLTKGLNLVGKPPQVYQAVLNLLDAVYQGQVGADMFLAETIRLLLIDRNERQQRIKALVTTLNTVQGAVPLSSEDIVNLIKQHMSLKGTSRLPVLVIAAVYQSAGEFLGERILPLRSHNAADLQTGALGDIEITLATEDEVVTSYEMKNKRLTREDINRALQKLLIHNQRVNNYVFITTEPIDPEVQDYARSLYAETGGIEFVILDCIGFLQHFLHLFHRLRNEFLETYQRLILAEPLSALSQPLKEAFLAMRQAAETGTEE